jgi:hypothetical protein
MREQLHPVRWALARLTFIVYIIFSVLSLVGGFLTAPLMTWYFFGDWRFWRHWRAGVRLLPHALRLTAMMVGHNRGFMFSVPLTSPPRSAPDPSSTFPRPDWPHGGSCGECSNCCKPGGHTCPLLDSERRRCRGYDSFYWRYFNCGRYPSVEEEIGYYGCRKWGLAPSGQSVAAPAGALRTIPVRVETRAGFAARYAGPDQLRSPRLRRSPSSPPIQPAATARPPALPMANHTASRCVPSQLKV